jgi:hypothetical protein
MSAGNPAEEAQKSVDENAIAQVEGEIRAFVRKDVAPWRRQQRAAAEQARTEQGRDPSRELAPNVTREASPTTATSPIPREIPVEGVNSLISRVASQSTEQIDKLIADLEGVRNLLRGEADRLQRELLGYADMSQTAMNSMKIISDSVTQWKTTVGNIRPELRSERDPLARPTP